MAEIGDVEVKKRKKKKKVLDLDSMLEGRLETPETPADNATPAASQEDAHADGLEDVLDNLEDFGKKKKKKKVVKKTEVVEGQVAVTEPVAKEEDDEDLNFGMKKKKKKGKVLDELVLKDQSEEPGGDETDIQFDDKETEDSNENVPCKNVVGGPSAKSWLNSDRDYTYEELLDRAFEIMRAKNPEMASGTKQKFVMRPPQVIRVGTKKSSFVNFMEICKLLHRPHKHLLDFLLSELGTSGSIDGNNQLIIKGRFQQKQIENVLRRYIKEYVTCHTCRSANTLLQKDFRLFFLQCEACGSRCSVAAIKLGFVAQVSKRAVMRAKAT